VTEGDREKMEKGESRKKKVSTQVAWQTALGSVLFGIGIDGSWLLLME